MQTKQSCILSQSLLSKDIANNILTFPLEHVCLAYNLFPAENKNVFWPSILKHIVSTSRFLLQTKRWSHSVSVDWKHSLKKQAFTSKVWPRMMLNITVCDTHEPYFRLKSNPVFWSVVTKVKVWPLWCEAYWWDVTDSILNYWTQDPKTEIAERDDWKWSELTSL